jgi:hypothetical protein
MGNILSCHLENHVFSRVILVSLAYLASKKIGSSLTVESEFGGILFSSCQFSRSIQRLSNSEMDLSFAKRISP